MKCPICKTDDTLFAVVTLRVEAPLLRGGGINLSGITVGQAQVKETWLANDVRYPVHCVACDSEFHYNVAESPGLKKGKPPEQLELFPDAEPEAAEDENADAGDDADED